MGLLLLVSVALMTLDHREGHLRSIRSGISLVLYPLHYAVNLPVAFGNWASEALSARATLLKENEAYRDKQLILEARLQKLAALETENDRLRDLLQSSRNVAQKLLIAELLAIDLDPFKRKVILNKGADDGVYEGHPLLDAKGVMGQVVHVSPVSSEAMLITDPSHAIPVQVNRNGLRAIALGTGESDQLEIPHIPNNADIKIGDLLVTSGLGQRFPPGYPVATITQIAKDPTRPYAQVVARPTAELERVREVLLVWPGLDSGTPGGDS